MFYMAHVSLVLNVVFFIYIARLKTKNQLCKYFMAFMVELFVWTFSVLAVQHCMNLGYAEYMMSFENLVYVGVSFIPVHILLICKTFSSPNRIKQTTSYNLVFFAVPVLTQLMVWTNDFHRAFYQSYSFFTKSDIVLGWYFYIHTVYSYGCLFVGIYYVVRFALGNKGRSNAQALIILVGTSIPAVINICYTFDIGNATIYATPVAFLFTMMAYFFGICRYNLLRLTSISLRTVIDKTSDLYIVVDEHMNVLDYNEPFYKVFSPLINLRKHISITDALYTLRQTGGNAEEIISAIQSCQKDLHVVHRDYQLAVGEEVIYFSMEFTALIIENDCYGCIILLRDVTRAMKDMAEIKRSQTMLIERERLASLGQLMGGIAHNLKTPIMAISGRTENLKALFSEYEESLGDETVTIDDHREIAKEMRQEVDKIQSHMAYISEIITTVKDQTVKFNEEILDSFTIEELVRRISILMQHELMRNNCELTYDPQIDEDTVLNGDINSLVQIIDNIIINAIDAYDGARGQIWLTISQARQDVIVAVRDTASGIPKDIQGKLFRQMITTKGKNGTGLGLYISYSTVVGKYGGKMWFDSVEGQGSEFFISIPCKA